MYTENNQEKIKQKIIELENELMELKSKLIPEETVKVPNQFEPIFNKAKETVKTYFSNLEFHPEKGTIEINDQRYVLIRASALSDEFFSNIQQVYSDKTKEEAFNIASSFLFDFAHLIGLQDAKRFHEIMDLKDPISKLSAGPVHFAHSGWAFVEILPESNPQPNEDFFLKYNHPYSFEADSWIKNNKKSDKPVCVMNAAYSSGWCEESFGIPLTAVELSCRAKGDEKCTFIMAHPSKIEKYIEEEVHSLKVKTSYHVPFFFERKNIEEKILKNEKFLNEAQKLSKLGSWEFDLRNNDLIWSEELFNIFELDSTIDKNILYEVFISKHHPDDLNELYKCIELASKNGKKYSLAHRIIPSSGKIKWILSSGVPIKDNKGEIVKLMGFSQDITNRINNEIELNTFFKLSIDLICLANFNGEFLKISNGWKKTLGYSIKDFISQPFMYYVHPDDIKKTAVALEKIKRGKIVFGFENRYRCKNGTYKILNWNASPDAKTGNIFCIVRDVTDEKKAELILKETLNEKEILLKEVHHRVKNNLQIISSLLNLQSSFINKKELIEPFNESQNRIKSIASIHELLYQSSDFGSISFKDYLNKLCSDLIYSYHGRKSLVQFDVEANFKLNIDTSIPLGLLINEIISNSLKHGLKNIESDRIFIQISKISSTEYELIINDNGIGFDFEKKLIKNNSLGLMLIQELSNQLNGEIEILNLEKGTGYRLIFSEN
jgi:PAS domain S-box-containing protein